MILGVQFDNTDDDDDDDEGGRGFGNNDVDDDSGSGAGDDDDDDDDAGGGGGRNCGGSVREEGRVNPVRAVLARSSGVFIPNFGRVARAARCRETPLCAFSHSLLFTAHSDVMRVRRAGLLLLCAALAVSVARRSSPEQEDVQEKMSSARCTSRCLTLHMTQLTAAFRHLQVQTDRPNSGV